MKNSIIVLKYCLVLTGVWIVYSCASYRSVPYFQNAEVFDGSKGANLYDLTIKPKDRLTIFVYSGTDAEAVAPFNIREPRELDYKQSRVTVQNRGRFHSYLVDNDGNIDFPILGKVHVGGNTIEKNNAFIREQIMHYLNLDTDCIVNTYIENFEVTVMGEVTVPNTFTLSRPKITVLEALAMAGDMTIYGKRDNVKILRELPDGTFEMHELDLRDANILNSPYYYLQQRDIVYVEPNEAMVQNAKIGQTTQLWLRGTSITLSLGSLLYRILQ